MVHGCTNVAWVGLTSVSLAIFENVDIRKYRLLIAGFSAKSVGRRTIEVRILGKILQISEILVVRRKTWSSDVNIFVSWTQYDDVLKDRNTCPLIGDKYYVITLSKWPWNHEPQAFLAS